MKSCECWPNGTQACTIFACNVISFSLVWRITSVKSRCWWPEVGWSSSKRKTTVVTNWVATNHLFGDPMVLTASWVGRDETWGGKNLTQATQPISEAWLRLTCLAKLPYFNTTIRDDTMGYRVIPEGSQAANHLLAILEGATLFTKDLIHLFTHSLHVPQHFTRATLVFELMRC